MSISGLVTTSALTAVENNIADVINLIKNWYDTKIIETEKKSYWSWSWQIYYFSRI